MDGLRTRIATARGFTLVELLVVILIIGILLAIALPTFLNQQEKGQDSGAQQSVTTSIHSAKTSYVSNGSAYPADTQLISDLGTDQPQYSFHSYDGGASPSTGPNDISVTRDSDSQVSLCAKSDSGHIFCARSNEIGGLSLASADTDDGGSLLASIPGVSLIYPEQAQAAVDNRTFSRCSGTVESDTRACLAGVSSGSAATGSAVPGWGEAELAAVDSGGSGGSGGGSGGGSPSAVASDLLLTSAFPDDGWTMKWFTANADNTNISELATIPNEMDQPLGAVAEFVQGGIVYGVNGTGDLISIDPQTGETAVVTPASAFCGGIGLYESYHSVDGAGNGQIDAICGGGIDKMNLDGSNAVTILSLPDGVSRLSANENSVAYMRWGCDQYPCSTNDPWIVSQNGGSPTKLTNTGQYTDVALSSTGTVALSKYINIGNGRHDVYVMPASGGSMTRLTFDNTRKVPGLDFSGDGSKVVYQPITVDFNAEVAVVPVAGGAPTKIVVPDSYGIDAMWLR